MAIPIPRDPGIDVTDVPRHCAGGSPVATASSNGINLLFPHGERCFVRSGYPFLDELSDPTLLAQGKAFSKQEGHHAHAHDELNAVLRAQGFEIDRFLDRYKRITSWVEKRMPAKLNLAGTAAAEHFTAILAEGAFDKGILDQLHPTMQKLLAWHAAEEIAHKAVAFDVLQQVDPSYALRLAGLAHATLFLSAFWLWGAAMLLRQEKLGWRGFRRQMKGLRDGERARGDGPVITRVLASAATSSTRRSMTSTGSSAST